MDKRQPERLTSEQYIPPHAAFQIFHDIVEGTVNLHWHEFYEMSFILRGEGVHLLNGVAYSMKPGNIFLLTPGDFHQITIIPGSECELFNVIFSDEILSDELRQLVFNEVKLHWTDFVGEEFNSIKAEYRLMWDEVKQPKLGSRVILQGALERVMIALTRKCLSAQHQQELNEGAFHLHTQPSIRKALIYMQHHFRENLTLEDVAKQAQFVPNYFSQCFKNAVGITFQNYLQDLRIKFAKSLLAASNLSITEICFASGFNTLAHFERVFKQKFGKSPRAYKNS